MSGVTIGSIWSDCGAGVDSLALMESSDDEALSSSAALTASKALDASETGASADGSRFASNFAATAGLTET